MTPMFADLLREQSGFRRHAGLSSFFR